MARFGEDIAPRKRKIKPGSALASTLEVIGSAGDVQRRALSPEQVNNGTVSGLIETAPRFEYDCDYVQLTTLGRQAVLALAGDEVFEFTATKKASPNYRM